MNLARLHGKGLFDDLGHEDPLVGEVLGVLRYLPHVAGSVVRRAAGPSGTLGEWATLRGVDLAITPARLRLWPALAGKEPDAHLLFLPNGAADPCLSVLIEAKHYASQHFIADEQGSPTVQAAWYHAAHLRWAWRDPLPAPPLAARATVLLTRHPWEPDEMNEVRKAAPDEPIFWLSWEAVGRGLAEAWAAAAPRVHEEPWLRLLEDALRCLDARGLRSRPFRGIPPAPPVPPPRPARWRGMPPVPALPRPIWRSK